MKIAASFFALAISLSEHGSDHHSVAGGTELQPLRRRELCGCRNFAAHKGAAPDRCYQSLIGEIFSWQIIVVLVVIGLAQMMSYEVMIKSGPRLRSLLN